MKSTSPKCPRSSFGSRRLQTHRGERACRRARYRAHDDPVGAPQQSLRRLNTWLRTTACAVRFGAITHIDAATLMEANEIAWGRLAFGSTVKSGRWQAPHEPVGSGYFDWDNPANNEFVAVRQLRVAGTKKAICPDIVAYVNGIPLAVIECKAPTLGPEWLNEATDQLERYQELGERWHQQGAPHLFHTVQMVVASCASGRSTRRSARLAVGSPNGSRCIRSTRNNSPSRCARALGVNCISKTRCSPGCSHRRACLISRATSSPMTPKVGNG